MIALKLFRNQITRNVWRFSSVGKTLHKPKLSNVASSSQLIITGLSRHINYVNLTNNYFLY